MADKSITVAVPEDRVPEFYAWFAAFLASEPGVGAPSSRPSRRGGGGPGRRGPWGGGSDEGEPRPWTEADLEDATWLYARLAEPAQALFDVLIDAPGTPVAGNDLASRLALAKGAHGVAGVLAWPGRYSRKLGRPLPLATEGRPDGGTDFVMTPDVAALFARAREAAAQAPPPRRGHGHHRGGPHR